MYTVSINVYMVYDRPVVHGNDTFNTLLSAFGLAASEADPCVYLYQNGTDFFIVALWVDDRLLICNNSILSYLKLNLSSHQKPQTDLWVFTLQEIVSTENCIYRNPVT